MRHRILVVKIIVAALLIVGAGVYFGLQGQYFGKSLSYHVTAIVVAVIGISGLLWLSAWYQARRM
jgi:ABC-type transporter Mla subunit MlaD